MFAWRSDVHLIIKINEKHTEKGNQLPQPRQERCTHPCSVDPWKVFRNRTVGRRQNVQGISQKLEPMRSWCWGDQISVAVVVVRASGHLEKSSRCFGGAKGQHSTTAPWAMLKLRCGRRGAFETVTVNVAHGRCEASRGPLLTISTCF